MSNDKGTSDPVEWPRQISPQRIDDTSTYDGAMPCLLRAANGDLVLIYRQSDEGHVSPTARIVVRRSSDWGQSWTDAQVIHDEPDRYTGAPSYAFDPESGRIVIFDRAYTRPWNEPFEGGSGDLVADTYRFESTDHGQTWSDPVCITDDLLVEKAWPFGGDVATSNGLMTEFYSLDGEIEALFSTDGGCTWGDNVIVADSTDIEGHHFTEPVPCAITKDRIITFGRDQATGDFFATRSRDGGRTWDDPVYFHPTSGDTPAPLWAKRTGGNEITIVWGDRDKLYLYAITMSAQVAWQDPSTMADEPKKRIHRHVGTREAVSYWEGGAGDFGYPSFAQLGEEPRQTAVAFYDEDDKPNIWIMSLY